MHALVDDDVVGYDALRFVSPVEYPLFGVDIIGVFYSAAAVAFYTVDKREPSRRAHRKIFVTIE